MPALYAMPTAQLELLAVAATSPAQRVPWRLLSIERKYKGSFNLMHQLYVKHFFLISNLIGFETIQIRLTFG